MSESPEQPIAGPHPEQPIYYPDEPPTTNPPQPPIGAHPAPPIYYPAHPIYRPPVDPGFSAPPGWGVNPGYGVRPTVDPGFSAPPGWGVDPGYGVRPPVHPAHPIVLPPDPSPAVVLPDPTSGYWCMSPGVNHCVWVVADSPDQAAYEYAKQTGLNVGQPVLVFTASEAYAVTTEQVSAVPAG